jgi:hypothetical protein
MKELYRECPAAKRRVARDNRRAAEHGQCMNAGAQVDDKAGGPDEYEVTVMW